MDAFNTSRNFPKPKSAGGILSPVDSRLNAADSSLIRYLLAGGSPVGNRTSRDSFSPTSIGINCSRGGSGSFGRSSPPLSRIENLISPPVPAKVVDENLWVMDDIFVDSSSGGRFAKSISSDSSGSPSSSRGFKMELCRSWEDNGHCRSGSKCQFAHGKEEVRPSFFSIKNKPGTPSMKSYNSASSSNSSMSRFSPPVNRQAPMETSPTATFFRPKSTIHSPAINSNISPIYSRESPIIIKPEFSKKSPLIIEPDFSKKRPITSKAITYQDWLPSDDGIEVHLPGSVDKCPPSNEDVEAYIRNALYGPSNRRRLPVFTEFCLPDSSLEFSSASS